MLRALLLQASFPFLPLDPLLACCLGSYSHTCPCKSSSLTLTTILPKCFSPLVWGWECHVHMLLWGSVRYYEIQWGAVRLGEVLWGLVRCSEVQWGAVRFSEVLWGWGCHVHTVLCSLCPTLCQHYQVLEGIYIHFQQPAWSSQKLYSISNKFRFYPAKICLWEQRGNKRRAPAGKYQV